MTGRKKDFLMIFQNNIFQYSIFQYSITYITFE